MNSYEESVIASAARFLIDGGEEDAANVLLSCQLDLFRSGDTWYAGDETHYALHVKLTGSRAAYDILSNKKHAITQQIQQAIQAVINEDEYIKHFTAHAELVDIDPDWRTELIEIARGKGVNNQAANTKNKYVWKNLNFRSESEKHIAEALDQAGVLFLPNCKARLGLPTNRQNREADFLVCLDGQWGILEVDGEPFHPPSRTVEDHERDRLFRSHSIKVVEHYDATRCYNNSNEVVQEFLGLLSKAHR